MKTYGKYPDYVDQRSSGMVLPWRFMWNARLDREYKEYKKYTSLRSTRRSRNTRSTREYKDPPEPPEVY